MAQYDISPLECYKQSVTLAGKIIDLEAQHGEKRPIMLHGIPRGGVHAAELVKAAIDHEFFSNSHLTEDPAAAHYFIDDLIDSGETALRYAKNYQSTPFLSLFTKGVNVENVWVTFPWERERGDTGSSDDIFVRLLQYIGEDPSRGGLHETPARAAKAWDFWTSGYDTDPASVLKVFEDGAEGCDEIVLVKNIPVYSHCEHHLAAIFGVAHVGYIPDGKIVGLSKINRVVDLFARRLQVQERLTNQIADTLQEHLGPLAVGVVLECRHLCMESRGVCQQGHSTITSALRGAFREDPTARSEFLSLVPKS